MTFAIEVGVPTVSGKRGRKPTEFPLDQMEVGNSFLIPCDAADKKAVESWRRKLLAAKKRFAEQYANGSQYKFMTATVADGLRVWRTA
jgi:hypothetical protein